MERGTIFDIQRFSLHDGPGIRTTVFLKGCPLNCLWCHNPESKAIKRELSYYDEHCCFCGECELACPNKCHRVEEGHHIIDRKDCTSCKKCVEACPKTALGIIGEYYTVDEVIKEALKDVTFYQNSGGGITLSGGEPMLFPEFSIEIIKAAKKNNLNTCIETTGFTKYENLKRIMPFTDIFLYDWKETDDNLHKKFTGVSNKLIYDNLMELDKAGAKIILRCPVIPGYNDRYEHYIGIAELANKLSNVLQINIMPYHTLGSSKCEAVGREYPLKGVEPLSEIEKEHCVSTIKKNTSVEVTT